MATTEDEKHQIIIPSELPMLAVRDVVVFPNMVLPLFVGRETSVLAIEAALAQDRLIFLATQKDQSVENPEPEDIYSVGTVSLILRMLKLPDGRLKILVQGKSKAMVKEYVKERPYFLVAMEVLPETTITEISPEAEALMRNAREMSEKILTLKGIMSPDLLAILESIEDPGHLADLVAANLRLKIDEAQMVLEEMDPIRSLIKVNDFLRKEMEVSAIQAKIQNQAREEMDRTQREYFLREQLRAIKKELGDLDETTKEMEEYRLKIAQARMPKQAEEEALKQLSRLEQMHPDSAETSIVRTYLDWLVALPWSKSTRDKLEVKEAKIILDEDHYDLEKVKDRILEYLSVRKLNQKMKGPILCFVGLRAWARPLWDGPLPGPWAGSSSASPWGACGTRPRSGATAAPISAPCRGGSFKGSRMPAPTTRCSCWTKLTRSAWIFGAIPPPPCWRCWTRSRTFPSATIT